MNKPCWSASDDTTTLTSALARERGLATPRSWQNLCASLATLLFSLVVTLVRADSLWTEQAAPRPLVSDKKAVAIGDILSIVVQESSTATKDNSTKTSKKSSVDASIASLFYSPATSTLLTKGGSLPALKFDATTGFDGGGKINNSERIIARIAVTVVDVLPNQNLVVEGRRTTSFAGETQEAVLRGVVRPADIAPNNTVFSFNVADASIKFVSKGTVTDSQRKGWFTRLWEKLTPF
jgi:flagellar L-ring protein precursor FlgH